MAYEKKSIRAIIDDVNSRRVYLPAIQRKYVWGDAQITKLIVGRRIEGDANGKLFFRCLSH